MNIRGLIFAAAVRLSDGAAGAQTSEADAAAWYLKAAEHDTTEGRAAKLRLAEAYEEGKGVPQSSLRALELYEELDEHESTADKVDKIHLAVLYEDVRGLTWAPQTRHREWFARTFQQTQAALAAANNASMGSSVEMQTRVVQVQIQTHFTLGLLHERGFGTAQDAAKAAEAYQTAMALSDVQHGPGYVSGSLLVNLGRLYEEGRGVAASPHLAATLYERATEGRVLGEGMGAIGQAERILGALHLGRMHELGHGVTRSDPAASRLYRDAAHMGHAAATYHVGRLYEAGRMYAEHDATVPLLSNAIAARSFARAARLGHVPAMAALARMYEHGLGVPRSEQKARHWHAQAAAFRFDVNDPLVRLARAGDDPSLRGGAAGDGDVGDEREGAEDAGEGADGQRRLSSIRPPADADAAGDAGGVPHPVHDAGDGLRGLQLLLIVTLCAAALLWVSIDMPPTADPSPRADVPPARADAPIPAGGSPNRTTLLLLHRLAPLALFHGAALLAAWGGSLPMGVGAAGLAGMGVMAQAVCVARWRLHVPPTPRASRTAQRRTRRATNTVGSRSCAATLARAVGRCSLVVRGGSTVAAVKFALSASLAILAVSTSAVDVYMNMRPSVPSASGSTVGAPAGAAGIVAGAADSVCPRYPDTRRANLIVLVLACSVGAVAFSAACVWLHRQRSLAASSVTSSVTREPIDEPTVDEIDASNVADAPAAEPDDVEQSEQRPVGSAAAAAVSQQAAQRQAATEYYAWRHRLMLRPHVVLMLLTMLIWLLLPQLHACFAVLTQAAMGNMLISLSSRLMTAGMEDPVRAAHLDTLVRNGKIIATGCLVAWLSAQRQVQMMAIDPNSGETADKVKSRLFLMMSRLALPTVSEDTEPEILMEEFFDCPRLRWSWSVSAFQNSHSLLRVPMQATQGAIAGIGGFAGAAHPLSGSAVLAMLMWNVGPWVQCSSFLDKHDLWSGPCLPIATLELATTLAAFVVMFLWARLTLGVVEHELYARHLHAATRRSSSGMTHRSSASAAVAAAAVPMTSMALEARPASANTPPDFLLCPITLEVMSDPVATADGQVYERAAIQAWLAEHDASPLTGVRLEHCELMSIPVIRSACLEFLAKRGERSDRACDCPVRFSGKAE